MSAFSLEGRQALVTGGGRGIGRGAAIALAKAGADVAVVARTTAQLDETLAALAPIGRKATARTLDLRDAAAIQPTVQSIWDELGGIDILVNCAGISPIFKRAERTELAEWDEILETNLRGTFLITIAVAQRLLAAERPGSIVNVTSIGAAVGLARAAAYSASKAGVENLTKTLALEWIGKNIRVNAVGPAFVETDLTAGLRNNPTLLASWLTRTPIGRIARVEEITGAIVYLASDAASYVTGQSLYVDGGWLAQ